LLNELPPTATPPITLQRRRRKSAPSKVLTTRHRAHAGAERRDVNYELASLPVCSIDRLRAVSRRRLLGLYAMLRAPTAGRRFRAFRAKPLSMLDFAITTSAFRRCRALTESQPISARSGDAEAADDFAASVPLL